MNITALLYLIVCTFFATLITKKFDNAFFSTGSITKNLGDLNCELVADFDPPLGALKSDTVAFTGTYKIPPAKKTSAAWDSRGHALVVCVEDASGERYGYVTKWTGDRFRYITKSVVKGNIATLYFEAKEPLLRVILGVMVWVCFCVFAIAIPLAWSGFMLLWREDRLRFL